MPTLPAFFLLLLLLAGFVPPAAAQSTPKVSLQPGGMLTMMGHAVPTEVYFNFDVDGIRGARDIAVSGNLLFVTGGFDNALSAWQINNAEVSFGVPVIIRVQSDLPVAEEVMVTITAQSGADSMAARPVTLSPSTRSADAIFPPGFLRSGRWIFTAQANPPTALDTGAARIAMQVLPPLLSLEPQQKQFALGSTVALTVRTTGWLEPASYAINAINTAVAWEGSTPTITVEYPAGATEQEVTFPAQQIANLGPWEFSIRLPDNSPFRVGDGSTAIVEIVIPRLRLVPLPERLALGSMVNLTVQANLGVPTEATYDIIARHLTSPSTVPIPIEVMHPAGVTTQEVSFSAQQINSPGQWEFSIQLPEGSPFQVTANGTATVYVAPVLSLRLQGEDFSQGDSLTIEVRTDSPPAMDASVTITARRQLDGVDVDAEETVILSPAPEVLSGQAVFSASALDVGEWVFTAQSEPPQALYTANARAEAAVLPPPLMLEVSAPREAVAPADLVTAENATVQTALALVANAVELTLNAPRIVTVGSTFPVTVGVAAGISLMGAVVTTVSFNVPDSKAIEVTLSGEQSTATVQFTAPVTAGIFTVEVRDSPTAIGMAALVTVEPVAIILRLNGPRTVTVSESYGVTVNTDVAIPEGTVVTVGVGSIIGSRRMVLSNNRLTADNPSAQGFFTAPERAGEVRHTGVLTSVQTKAGSLQVSVASAREIRVMVEAVSRRLQLRLEAPPEVTARDSFEVTVFAEPEVPAGTTVTVTVRFEEDETDRASVEMTPGASMAVISVTAPDRLVADLKLMASGEAADADPRVQQVTVAAASATMNIVAQLVQLMLMAPAAVDAGAEFSVMVSVSPALLADTTLTVQVFFGEASSRQVTLSDKVSSQEVSFPTSATGTLEVSAQAVEVEPADLVVAAAAQTQTVEVLAEGTVELTLDAPKSVMVGSTFPVTVGVAEETPLPESTAVTATLSFSAADSATIIKEIDVTLTGEQSTATEEFTAPVRSGIFRVEVSGRAVIGASASVTVVPVAVMLQLSAPNAVTVRQGYQVTVDTVMPVPEGTTLEVTVSAGTERQEVSLTAANPSEDAPFTAPLNVGEVMVAATVKVQTAPNAREVAVAAAVTQTVQVLPEGTVALTLDAPLSVTVGDTFTVTVGVSEETSLPESVSVTATISLLAANGDERERKEVVLTSASSSVRTAFTAPVTAGLFSVAVSGREETGSIDGVAATSAQVSAEAVAVRLQLSGPAAVFVGQGYQVTVGTNMTVPAGTTLEVTVTASAGTDLQVQKDLVSLTADNSEEVPFTAPLTAGAVMVTAMAEVQTAADAREVAVPDATTLAVLIITPAALSLQPEGMLIRMEHAVFTERYFSPPQGIDLNIVVSGDLLFATTAFESALSVWRVNAEAGTLSQTMAYRNGSQDDAGNTISGLSGASGTAVSGNLLFVTAFADNALSVWRVNRASGTLRQTALYRNGDRDDGGNQVSGLSGAAAAVSGDLLFVTSANDDALSVWRVNESSGTLRQTAVYLDSDFGGLDRVLNMAVSDNLLFVTALDDDALSAWRINTEAGTLSRTDLHREDGVNNIDVLSGPAGIAVRGDLLFVTSANDDALSVWRINAEAGTLSQAEVYRDGVSGIDGLERAQGVAVSGDLLFVTAQIDSALSVWRINAEAETGVLRQTALHRDSVLFNAVQVGASGDVLFVSGQQNAGTISVWHINNAELPFGEPLTVRVQSDTPVLREVEVTVTARNGADTAAAVVTLSPENLSAEAIFAADDLVPGRWIFTAEAEPSTLLDTSAARIAVQVLAPVQLTLDVPPSVTVGDMLAVTVGVAAETPLPEGASVTATLSFRAGGDDDRVVTLTSEMLSATERFTAPVTAGVFRAEVSGEMSAGTVLGASASVTVEPVAVMLRLSGPQEAVTVGQTYTVTVDTVVPVPAGTTLEVTVSAGAAPQEVVSLAGDIPGQATFTAPARADQVTVTAMATTVQTAPGTLEVAVSAADTLTVTVSALDVQLVLSEFPLDPVAAGSTFTVTVGTEPALPEDTAVQVTVSLAAFSSEPVALMPNAPTASVIVAAPTAGGEATLSATGEEAADSTLELNVLAAEAVTVQVRVQVSLSLRLEAPPEVTARDSFAVTVFTEPEVPGGATVTVTVVFDGADSSPVVLSAETTSAAVMLTAPRRIENDLELMTSSVVTVADANVLQVVVTEASATVNAAAQSVQLTLVAMPERVAAGQEVAVTAGVSPALLADTTLTVKVFFGEASSRQVTLSDKVSSQEVSFPTSATGTLEVRAQAVEVEPADLVVAAAAPTQTVEVLAEGTVELTLEAPKSVTVGSTFPVTVGVTAGTPLPVGSSVSATLSLNAVDSEDDSEDIEVVLIPGAPSTTVILTAPRRSGIFVVAARGAEDSLAIRFVVGTSAQVSVEPLRVTLTLGGPDAVTVGETYQVMVGTDMAVPEGTTLEVTVSDGTVSREVSLAADNSEEVSFTAPANVRQVTVTATAMVRTDADALEVAAPAAKAVTVQVQVEVLHLELQQGQPLTAGSKVILAVQLDRELPTTISYSVMALHTVSAMTTSVLTMHPAGTTTHLVSFSGQQIASPGQWEFSIVPAESPFEGVPTTATISLDFIQPQGTINADDLVFALRYLVLCEGSAAGCQANRENLASLARNLGNDLRIEQLPAALQLPNVSGGSEERPAANWFILLLGLQGLPVELLSPASEQEPRQLEKAIRNVLSVQEE